MPKHYYHICLLLVTPLSLGASFLLDSYTFEGAFIEIPPSAQSSGRLPTGWEDDTDGTGTSVRYAVSAIAPFSGSQSLAIDLSSTEGGSARLASPSFELMGSEVIRLKMGLRSPTSSLLEIQLVDGGDPSRVYWSASFQMGPEWRSEVSLMAAPEGSETVRFLILMPVPGRIETDEWTIEGLALSELEEERAFSANLLPSSAFPLGVVAPYNAGGNYRTDDAVVSDPSVVGPSGLPTLRLMGFKSDWGTTVRLTVPFQARPLRQHTFSVWMKGSPGQSSQWVYMELGYKENLTSVPFSLTSEWQRFDITGALPFSSTGTQLARVRSDSIVPFWVDGWRVVESADDASYTPSGPLELSIDPLAESDLYYYGEPFEIEYALWGNFENAYAIEARLRAADGTTQVFEPIPLAGELGDLIQQTWQLPERDYNTLGSFVVQMRALDAVGVPLSKWAEASLHRIRRPHFENEMAPDSPFGTHIFGTDREARRIKQLGFNWVRTNYQFSWSWIQQQQGAWNWDDLDQRMNVLKDAKLMVLGYLSSAPMWASTASFAWQGGNSGWYRFVAPPRNDEASLNAFEEYAFRVMERYADSIDALEVWNEPFLAGFFPDDVIDGAPVRAPASHLHNMTQRVRSAADRANFTKPIGWNIGGNYGEDEQAFDQENIELGTPALVDLYTIHRYSQLPIGYPGDVIMDDLTMLREQYPETRNGGRSLWLTEGSVVASEIFNLYEFSPPAASASMINQQNRNFLLYHLGYLAAGYGKIFSYAFFEQDDWTANYSFMQADGRLSQIATLFSNLSHHLECREFIRHTSLDFGAIAWEFGPQAGNGRSVAVVLNPQKRRILTSVPQGTRILDVYGNQVPIPCILDSKFVYLLADDLGSTLPLLSDSILQTDSNSPFVIFKDLGDSLRQTYLGLLNDSWWPWVEHAGMGRLYVVPASGSQKFYLFDYQLGSWLYTGAGLYPWLYHYGLGAWCYQVIAPGNSERWLWMLDSSGGRWIQ